MKHLLREVLQRANQYLVGLDKRSVAPSLDVCQSPSQSYINPSRMNLPNPKTSLLFSMILAHLQLLVAPGHAILGS